MKNHILFSCLLLALVLAQPIPELQLGIQIKIQLDQNHPKKYTITIPSEQATETGNLYLHAIPIFMDPLQVPSIFITADHQYTAHCYNAHVEFSGICLIPTRELTPNRTFHIEIKCITDCKIKLESYFSKEVQIVLGGNLQVHSLDIFAFKSQNILVKIPDNLKFTKIVVIAQITNLQENINQYEEAVDLFINYGDPETLEPTQQLHKLQSQQFNGGGRICFIDAVHFKGIENKVVKAYLKIKSGITVNFHAYSLDGNKYDIALGNKNFGYANKENSQEYKLAISKKELSENNTIQIMLDVFSGKPKLTIGFDASYSKVVTIEERETSASLLITPKMREDHLFDGFLMIKVESQPDSEYILYPTLTREDINIIEPYYTYFDELNLGQITNYLFVQKYKYLQGSDSNKPEALFKNYSFKVDFKSGDGDFYVRRCSSLQVSSNVKRLRQCTIVDATYLNSSQFQASAVENQKIFQGNILTININYDIRKCTQIRKFQKQIYVICAYQLVIVGSTKKITDFSFQVQRKNHINYIRENKITKEYIYKNNYAYFSFYLPNLNQVKEIDIFTTTFSGQSTIIYSTSQKFPTLESTAKDILKQSSIKHNLIIKKDRLQENIYISIYAFTSTEINIGVIVRRNTQENNVPEFPLAKNNLQQKTLKKRETIVYKITTRQKEEVTVFINDISGGALKIKLYSKNKKEIKCDDEVQKIFICSFISQIDVYYVQVVNEILSQATFTVIFKDNDDKCLQSSLNMPIFTQLGSLEVQCFSFTVNMLQSLRFSSSLTDIQTLSQVIPFLKIKGANVMTLSHNYDIISQSKIQKHCPKVLSNNHFQQSCEIIVNFENLQQSTQHFNFALSEQDGQILMFDGLNQKVIFDDPDNDERKDFYYEVTHATKMLIFISTATSQSNYFVVGKFIPKQQFLSKHENKQSIYEGYVQAKERASKANKENYYYTTVTAAGLSTISIQQSQITPFIPSGGECYFVLSVFIDPIYKNKHFTEDPFFDLQISQKNTYLRLGQSKIGHINKGETFTYIVDPNDGIVEFNIINKVEATDDICLSIIGTNSKETIMKTQTIYSNYLQTYKFQKIESIFIHGKSDDCSFEIRYISNENPFINIKLAHPYEMTLEKNQMKKFIYFNKNLLGLKIAEMASAGDSKIYIKPINSREVSFALLLQYKLQDFPIQDFNHGKYLLSSMDKLFCTNCYYYVIVTTQTRFVGQIVILKTYDPIPLTTNHILKENLVPKTQNSESSYVFYSKKSFNLEVNIISGKIKVMVKDYLNKQLFVEVLQHTQNIRIDIPEAQGKGIDSMYIQEAKYKIFIESVSQSIYYLQVKRDEWHKKIISGYPSKIILEQDDSQIVQFSSSQLQTRQMNIMIDVNELNEANLTFLFKIKFNNGVEMKVTEIKPINVVRSENTYIITLNNVKATYLMTISSQKRVEATLLLIENSLTHILPAHNYLFNHDGVYHINADKNKVLVEVFNCQGEISLEAVNSITLGQQSNKLDLKRPNYGGHYVFGLQPKTAFNNYYILVKNRQPSSVISYIINYYYYNSVNPYQIIDAKNYDISYEVFQSGITIKVNPPALIQNNTQNGWIQIKSISYHAFGSLQKASAIKYSRCNIKEESNKVIKLQGSSLSNLQLSFEQINALKGDNETNSSSTAVFYLIVEASVQISIRTDKNTQKFPSMLTLYYNTIEIPLGLTFDNQIIVEVSQTKKYWFTDSIILFVIWLVLPFLLALVSLFYLLRYFLAKLMRRQTNMVEEVDIEPQVGMSLPSQTQGQTQQFGQAALGTTEQFQKDNQPPESGAVLCKENL